MLFIPEKTCCGKISFESSVTNVFGWNSCYMLLSISALSLRPNFVKHFLRKLHLKRQTILNVNFYKLSVSCWIMENIFYYNLILQGTFLSNILSTVSILSRWSVIYTFWKFYLFLCSSYKALHLCNTLSCKVLSTWNYCLSEKEIIVNFWVLCIFNQGILY